MSSRTATLPSAPAQLLETLSATLRRTLPMARIEVHDLPGSTLRLGLINADFPLGPLPPETMTAVLAEPAYWAFCWGSGLALARHLEGDPDLVRGRSVLDLGSGSGVVGIAAKRAGARRVVACDTDPAARVATAVNAQLNGVDLEIVERLEGQTGRHDLVVMADVLYDASNVALLEAACRIAPRVLVADSRVTRLPLPGFRHLGDREARTFPNLGEFDTFRTVHLFGRGL